MKLFTSIFIMLAIFSGCNNYEDELNQNSTQDANLQDGKLVFETVGCGGCHGGDAQTSALGVSRIIAQIDTKRDIENALYYLKTNGAGRNSAMVDVAQGLNEQMMLDVAAYVHSLKL